MDPFCTYIDHTLLSPEASETDIRKLCEEAWIHQFKALCITPVYVAYVREMLEFCPVKIEIASVIGFPLGTSTTKAKIFEGKEALQQGATELDVVLNLSLFKSMAYQSVQFELQELAQLAHDQGAILKTILPCNHLDQFELYTACEICAEAGTDFVQPSVFMEHPDQQAEIIRKMRTILPASVKIKAAADVTDLAQVMQCIEAGASRIGTTQGPNLMSQL